MTNANTNIQLDSLHTAIEDAIKAQFPDLATVEFYSEVRKNVPKPACLLELTEMDVTMDDDPGTEQLAVMASFEARLVIGFRDNDMKAKLEVRKLAGALAAWIHKTRNRWGLPVGPATVVGCYQDNFEPELDQYEVWRVEWQQTLHLGETIWTDGTRPDGAFYSFTPDVGLGNEDKYRALDGVTAPTINE